MSNETVQPPLLVVEGISKAFGGVQALRDVNFALRSGEIQAIVGQNGAGKSTLIKIMSGALRPDSGRLRVHDMDTAFSSPAAALQLGIATVYQDPLVYPELSVTENIFMGRELRDRLGMVDMSAQIERVRQLLRDLEVPEQLATQPIGALSVALRQLALIAKALSWEPKVLIFDEPTAILTQHEADTLFGIIRRLRQRGVGIIYISHRLEEIFALADRVTVLKDGETKGTWPLQPTTDSKIPTTDELIEVMAGRGLMEGSAGEERDFSQLDPVLAVSGLTHQKAYQDIHFEVRPGEILGLFGLVGAGRSEVARAIFGEEPAEQGDIYLDGKALKIRSPEQALQHGIAYLPEDRKGQGLFGSLSVGYNTTVTVMKRLALGHAIVRPVREEEVTQGYIKTLSIKTPNTRVNIANLSGGNQQKVVLSKWLAADPRVFIMDEPTAGVDVAAKQEIHKLILDLAQRGVAIIVISSELTEVLKLSDRVITMHEGHITGEFPRHTAANTVLAAAMEQGAALTTAIEEQAAASSPGKVGRREEHASLFAHIAGGDLRSVVARREMSVLAILILGSLIFGITHPTFLSFNNIVSILLNVAVVAIISIGMTAVIITGGIDVSVGSLLALCMLIPAKVAGSGLDNVLILTLVALGVGLLMGILNGVLVSYGRIHPIIVTLGTLNIIRALHIQILGPRWIQSPASSRIISLGAVAGIPVPFLLVVIIGLLATMFLARRALGRHIYGLGGNVDAARLAGIHIRKVTIFVYAFTGLLVGLAALIQLGLSGTVQPNAGVGLELQVIAATVIGGTNILGGRGTVIGSILGALLVEAVHNALITIGTIALLEGLVIGVLIIIAVGLDVLQSRKAALA